MNRAKLLRYLASCIVLQITRPNRPAIRHQNSLRLDFLFDSGFARETNKTNKQNNRSEKNKKLNNFIFNSVLAEAVFKNEIDPGAKK